MKAEIGIGWLVFWLYWLIASRGAKPGTRLRTLPPGWRLVVVALVLTRVFATSAGDVRDTGLEVAGVAVFAAGLGFAVWARIQLGRNWGMPMTEKEEPELVTTGPYGLVRHPIYTGILGGLLGTALAINVYWLIPFAISAAYFLHSARTEEGIMARNFPDAYRAYRARTKMLIPFVL